jgi:hypothetical protein
LARRRPACGGDAGGPDRRGQLHRTPASRSAAARTTLTCTPGTLAADNYSFATGNTANFTINKAT